MLTTTGLLMGAARARREALLAFNVITLEHAEAIVAAAEECGRPVVLQVSENAVRYHGSAAPIVSACLALAAGAATDVSVHLDHVEDDALLRAAPDLGVSSVMVDASRLPDEENVARTREAAGWLRSHGLYVEAELGAVGGKGGAHTPGVRTDPDDAAAYVAATGVDALAVAVGSSHAMTTRTATVDQRLVAALAAAVPVPLVLHGSSGIPDRTLADAVANGMVKINIGTLLNVSFTGAIRAALAAEPDKVDPRGPLRAARTDVTRSVAALLRALDATALRDPAPTS